MSLANCKSCGVLFLKQRSVYCDKCVKQQDAYYFKFREFMKTNPNCSVIEAHQHTGIPLSKLLELRREDYAPYER